jgi:hypothetical protein
MTLHSQWGFHVETYVYVKLGENVRDRYREFLCTECITCSCRALLSGLWENILIPCVLCFVYLFIIPIVLYIIKHQFFALVDT